MRFFRWEIISADKLKHIEFMNEIKNKDLHNVHSILKVCKETLLECRKQNDVQGVQLGKFKQKALVNHPITGKMAAFRKMNKAAQQRFFAEDARGK